MTQTENQSEPVKNRTDILEDEIELIDLLRVIWKWKYLIIGGTVVCALAAVIISFYMQPIYQISMVLKSGINKVDVGGKRVYLDSVEDFKTLIEGELLFKVLDHSKIRNKKGVLSSGEYKITADTKTNTLNILYESADKEEGIENLIYLSNMLSENYENRLTYLQDNNKHEIMVAKRQLEFSIDEEKFITSKLIDIQKRIDRYTQEIGQINDSSESKAKSQNTLLDYASIVEKITDMKRRHSHVSSQIAFYKKEIEDLEKEKIGKQVIIMAIPPTASQHPIKPKKKLILISATFIGIFMMVFFSFLIEYIPKNKTQKSSTE